LEADVTNPTTVPAYGERRGCSTGMVRLTILTPVVVKPMTKRDRSRSGSDEVVTSAIEAAAATPSSATSILRLGKRSSSNPITGPDAKKPAGRREAKPGSSSFICSTRGIQLASVS